VVAEDFLQDAQVRQWLDGVEPAWTLLTFDSLRTLRQEPSASQTAIRIANDLSADEIVVGVWVEGRVGRLGSRRGWTTVRLLGPKMDIRSQIEMSVSVASALPSIADIRWCGQKTLTCSGLLKHRYRGQVSMLRFVRSSDGQVSSRLRR